MKPSPTVVAALLLFAAPAFAGGLPKGTIVRMQGSGIESGWHQGKITVTSEGCTMVALDKPTKEGYTLIALIATARLERQQSGAWTDVPVKALQAQEPKLCLEDGAD
jgi:hypothetical protein